MIIYENSHAVAPNNWELMTISELASTMQDMDAAGVRTTPENICRHGYSMDVIGLYGLRAARLARLRSLMAVIK